MYRRGLPVIIQYRQAEALENGGCYSKAREIVELVIRIWQEDSPVVLSEKQACEICCFQARVSEVAGLIRKLIKRLALVQTGAQVRTKRPRPQGRH